MKKLLIFALLLISAQVFGQGRVISNGAEYKAYQVTLTLSGTDADTIFVLFPPFYSANHYAPSETRPTATNATQLAGVAEWIANGDITVSVLTDTATGSADESDSLTTKIVPIDFYRTSSDNSSGKIYVVSGIASFPNLSNGTIGTSATYLNWAADAAYGFSLAGELWPFRGFAFIASQVANDEGATVVSYLYVNINIPK